MASLSVAVIGAGGVGSTFAFYLAQAGHDVTVVARPGSPRLAQLQRDGGIVRTTGERAAVRVAAALDLQAPYDLVLVTTLAHQVDALLPDLARSSARWVQFMFNTAAPERLQAAVGAQRCSFGMPFVMATVAADGRLDAAIGWGQTTRHGDSRWVDLFAAAGIPSVLDPDMPQWLRCHAPLCIAMESISAAGQRRGGGATWEESWVVARGLKAGFTIIRASGYRLYPSAKAVLNAMPVAFLAGMLWGVSRITSFRELLATGTGECRALIDAMVAAADGAKLKLPDALASLQAMKPP